MRSICKTLDIALADVMAFGDNYNDVSMLDIVGVPYIMAVSYTHLDVYKRQHLSRALAAQGIGSARFDFYGNGESDGEFEDMSFDGLHRCV